MAELTIELLVNPESGKKDVIIRYRSDEDALPLEHEDAHRALVGRLIEGGALQAAELGQIVLERAGGERVAQVDEQQEEKLEVLGEELGD
ncbi:MAG: hypothetical protein JRH20_23940 [Deltaproteobacteria bacterium]|nr:hypothetical protein [Deltaproteobacteria bacterium]